MTLTIARLSNMHKGILAGLGEFFTVQGLQPEPPVSTAGGKTADELNELYTRSANYLQYTTVYHTSEPVLTFLCKLSELEIETVIDLGCASGYTGLVWALYGKRVRFMDFDGLGLKFVNWFVNKHELDAEVVPYGAEFGLPPCDLLCSFDVLEHVPNHLHFIDWASTMAGQVAMCWPLMSDIPPPYELVVDGKVYDGVVKEYLSRQYNVKQSYVAQGRSFAHWAVEQNA